MKLLSIILLTLITIGSGIFLNVDKLDKLPSDEMHEDVAITFSWVGDWNYQNGDINMTIKIFQDGSGFIGRHCMVDGGIHGGANDCATKSANNQFEHTLTNSTQINSNTLEFDFESGYTASSGKARLIKASDTEIRFIITEEPTRFVLSPLGSYLGINDGIGLNATGGIILTKQ